jgi:serine/threonine-protein kinase
LLGQIACLPIIGPAQPTVYAGSGWNAVRRQDVEDGTHILMQFVVLFPSAHDADAFFTASAKSWPACANRQFTTLKPNMVVTVGPVPNANGTLSVTRTADNAACQRALTVANNVAIDVVAISYNPADAAVTIARQIAAKVPTT